MPGTEPLCWDNGNPAFSASGSTKWPTKRIILQDGKALIDWGVPFTARPSGFKVKFSYNGLGDECSLVATLENRSLDEEQKTIRKYVATAAYIGKTDSENITNCLTRISEPDDNGLRTLEVDFLYGEYPENVNEFPENVTQAEADEEITHVNVVFVSSAHGDYFEGIKNASLIVKDFEFIYPEENIQ